MFAAADLLPYVDFDVERCIAHARALRPGLETIVLSARTGEHMDAWYAWIRATRFTLSQASTRATRLASPAVHS